MRVNLRNMLKRVADVRRRLTEMAEEVDGLDIEGLTKLEAVLDALDKELEDHLEKPTTHRPSIQGAMARASAASPIMLNQLKLRRPVISEATFRTEISNIAQQVTDFDSDLMNDPLFTRTSLNEPQFGLDRSEMEQVFDDIDQKFDIRLDRSNLSENMSVEDLVLLAVQAHRNPVEPEFPEEPMPE